jgi:hypothetical protein
MDADMVPPFNAFGNRPGFIQGSWVVLGLAMLLGCGHEPTGKEGADTLAKAFAGSTAPPIAQLAIAASKSNDFGQSIVALQEVKRAPGLTPEQLQAVDEASLAMTRELLRRAESGDAAAKAALQQIERTRSQ